MNVRVKMLGVLVLQSESIVNVTDSYESSQIGLWEVFCSFTIENVVLTLPTEEELK